jgi:hypothetical protein
MARQSFQELTEFSRENKELEGSPSNLDVFSLERFMYFYNSAE